MRDLRHRAYTLLRRSEAIFKTDMIYVARGGFWVGLGQAVSMILVFISSILFANIIAKDVYGNYKFIIATTSILGAFSLSGMGAVVTQGTAQGSEGILKDAIHTTLRWSSIIIGIAFITAFYYFHNDNTALGLSMLIAGATLPFINAYGLYGSYLNGKRDFKHVTIFNSVSQVLTTAALLLVAMLTKNIIAMVVTYFGMTVFTVLWGYRMTLSKFPHNDTRDNSLIAYSKHLSFMNLFSTLANQLDKILIFHYLGAAELAIYSFAQAIPEQAKGAFKNFFGIVTPKYATFSESDLRKSISHKFLRLTAIAIVIALVYIACAPLIFKLLFPKYMEAVFYSQVYAIGLVTIPGIYLFSTYFQVMKATRTLHMLNIIGNASTIVMSFILIYNFGLKGAVIENSVSWFIILLSNLYFYAKNMQR